MTDILPWQLNRPTRQLTAFCATLHHAP